ncbi:YraN family protein [Halanaerobaculum tunisiense]
MDNRQKGTRGEKLAKDFLQQQGYQIKEQNFWSRYGEIDLIAQEDNYLVFVEVKWTTENPEVRPEEQISYQKQRHLTKVANYYLMLHNIESNCRFDVVAISQLGQGNKIRLIKNAFLVN